MKKEEIIDLIQSRIHSFDDQIKDKKSEVAKLEIEITQLLARKSEANAILMQIECLNKK